MYSRHHVAPSPIATLACLQVTSAHDCHPLRCRYKALREAICSLQGVWRERRGMQQPHPTPSHADSSMPDHQHARGDDMGAGGGGGMDSADTAMGGWVGLLLPCLHHPLI